MKYKHAINICNDYQLLFVFVLFSIAGPKSFGYNMTQEYLFYVVYGLINYVIFKTEFLGAFTGSVQ